MWRLIKRLFGKKDHVDLSRHATDDLDEAARNRADETRSKLALEFRAANELKRKKHAAYLGVKRNIVSYDHIENAKLFQWSRGLQSDLQSQESMSAHTYGGQFGGLGGLRSAAAGIFL